MLIADEPVDCLNRDDYDNGLRDQINPYPDPYAADDEHTYGHGLEAHEAVINHPCSELKKMLSGGTFYYSVDFDLTNRLQDR